MGRKVSSLGNHLLFANKEGRVEAILCIPPMQDLFDCRLLLTRSSNRGRKFVICLPCQASGQNLIWEHIWEKGPIGN